MTLLLAITCALAAEPAELLQIYAKFSHVEHRDSFERRGLTCVSCHQVGTFGPESWGSEALSRAFIASPEGACHGCHAPAVGRAYGPRGCPLCHEALAPAASHDTSFLERHGAEARLGVRSCRDCHAGGWCVDCHERKERVNTLVHERTWMGIHGIAARVDPASCDTCHLAVECERCHTSGGRTP